MGQTNRREIYWKYNAQYARQEELLAEWPNQERNKHAIHDFQEHLIAKGTGKYRTAKVISHLRRICDLQPRLDLREATKEDVRAIVAKVNTQETWGAHSKADFTRVLKHYYRWYEDEDPRLQNGNDKAREQARQLYKYLSKHVKVAKPRMKIGEDEILTDEDLQALLKGCRTPLERAFVAVLHNTGARIGEMLNIRIHDYQRKGKHAMIRLDGKTGERRVPILQAIPPLEEWLRVHPDKTNQSAFMWVSMSERHYGNPLAYLGALKLLRRVFERAGVHKKSHPHFFRHSRATIWARTFSQALLNQLMGWAQGSAQAQTYIHLGARDVEDSFLKSHGILPQEQAQPTAQFCACGETNTADAKYCYKCGQPLNIRTVMDEQDALRRAFAELPRILADPELKARYEQKLREFTQE